MAENNEDSELEIKTEPIEDIKVEPEEITNEAENTQEEGGTAPISMDSLMFVDSSDLKAESGDERESDSPIQNDHQYALMTPEQNNHDEHDNNEDGVEITGSSIENEGIRRSARQRTSFKWNWFDETYNGVPLHKVFKKTAKSGHVYCMSCSKSVSYAGRGCESLIEHIKSSIHKEMASKTRNSDVRPKAATVPPLLHDRHDDFEGGYVIPTPKPVREKPNKPPPEPYVYVDEPNISFSSFKQPSDPADSGMSPVEEAYLDVMLTDINSEISLTEAELSCSFLCPSEEVNVDEDSDDEDGILSWQANNRIDINAAKPQSFPFNPSKSPGIQQSMLNKFISQTAKTPIHFFSFFLSFDFVASICQSTNVYAHDIFKDGKYKLPIDDSGQTWTPVTTMEMYKFIGILMYMSLVKFKDLDKYWSNSELYNPTSGLIKGAMTMSRFYAILSVLQISSQTTKTENVKNEIVPILRHMRIVSQALFHPFREVAIGERMLATKTQLMNHLGVQQDENFGCKLFSLVCTVTGYTQDMLLYRGSDFVTMSHKQNGIPFTAVEELTKTIKNEGYHLYLDHFFISQKLLDFLYSHKTYATGRLKGNSATVPWNLRDWRDWEDAAQIGDFRWHRSDLRYVVVQRKQRKTNSYFSMVHSGSDVKTDKDKNKIPQVVVDFNEGLKGFEKSVSHTCSYPFTIGKERLHWWKSVFIQCIDVMVMNSFVIYKEYIDRSPGEITEQCNEMEFRESLIKSLIGYKKGNLNLPADSIKTTPSSSCMPTVREIGSSCVLCQTKEMLQGSVLVSGVKSTVFCGTCDVPLCLTKKRNCFAEWHSPEGKKYSDKVFASRNRKRKIPADDG